MRIGFVGGSYTPSSPAIADEECINWYYESRQSQGAVASSKAYGGQAASSLPSLIRTPGLMAFATNLPGSPRGNGIDCNGRVFQVCGGAFCELNADGTFHNWGAVANDGTVASLAFNSIQVLIISAGHAYCFTLATNTLLEVTNLLAGTPIQCEMIDTYFIVCFANSNKFQMSQVLDGTTWPGQLVNEVSVFPENIVSIIANHRELWIFGSKHCQPYQDTGSTEVFDPIAGTMLETGSDATFSVTRADNSVFWIGKDERGAQVAWRSNGYTPQRVSTYAVEVDLTKIDANPGLTACAYAYQENGHLFWVLYIPGAAWSWVYDVSEGIWHKRSKFINGVYAAHWASNHVFAFGKHLVGDWASATIYEMSAKYLDDNATLIRRLRRAPTVIDEMKRIPHAELAVDFMPGIGPQPPLKDGAGNPRPPQAMLRWSDDRGQTWSNEHWTGVGLAGQTKMRAIWFRLGQSRYRVYELVVTDPVDWVIVDAYWRPGNQAAA